MAKNQALFPPSEVVWFSVSPVLEAKQGLRIDAAELTNFVSLSSEPHSTPMNSGAQTMDECILSCRADHRQMAALRLAKGISFLKSILVVKDAIVALQVVSQPNFPLCKPRNKVNHVPERWRAMQKAHLPEQPSRTWLPLRPRNSR